MVDEIPDPTCAVCGRRLLPGERAIAFVTRDGETIEVCELCKPRAEAAGWLTPEEAEAAGGATAGRERRRSRGAQVLGGLLARRPQPETDGGPPEPSAARGAAAAEPPPAEPDADPDPVDAPEPVPTGTTVAEALRAFNRSDHRRTVAGLTRTLGPPRATALVVKGNGSGDTVRLTIAWEITWYQWEVAASGRGHEVRESGKGETIDQLRTPDRAWNLMAAADGTLEEKTASATPVEEA
ncbi:MAG TPA: hypothetical protein VFS73_02180 [Solirubrobacterales bacterium]|jgi:hypothetical protein|nr:hypothetical protein [Solirubrobacterales bacterium]